MPPSWIFKFVKFHWQTMSGTHRLIILLSVVKIGRLIVEILQFFEFSKWPSLPFLIFWKRNFIGYWGREGRDASAYQISSKWSIGCKDIKIFRFFKMAAAAILSNSQNFIGWQWPDGPDASLHQISSKLVVLLRRYCNFSYFQDDHRRYLGFLKSRNFIGYLGGDDWDASPRQILSKSVNRSQRYYDFSIIQNGGRRHLGL